MASMSTWLIAFGALIITLCAGAYFGLLNHYIDPLRQGAGGLFAVMLTTVAVVGIFFIALGILYRQWE